MGAVEAAGSEAEAAVSAAAGMAGMAVARAGEGAGWDSGAGWRSSCTIRSIFRGTPLTRTHTNMSSGEKLGSSSMGTSTSPCMDLCSSPAHYRWS